MAFIINPVTNIKGTPGVLTGTIAERPTGAQDGVIYLSTDTGEIYSYQLSTLTWILIATNGGGGGTPDLDQVCTVGNIYTDPVAAAILVQKDSTNTQAAIVAGARGSGYLSLRRNIVGGIVSLLLAENITAARDHQLPDAAGTLVNSVNGLLADAAGNVQLPVLDAGTFTPAISNTTNVADQVINNVQYLRLGNVVTVSGVIEIECTAAFAATSFDITVPIASAFTDYFQCAGSITTYKNGSIQYGTVTANAATSKALFEYDAASDGILEKIVFHFTYQLV